MIHAFWWGNIMPDDFYDHVDSVNVPSNMLWLNCTYIGTGITGIFPDPGRMRHGEHQNSGNYTFVDGHGETNSIRPFQDRWFATGGAAFTYSLLNRFCSHHTEAP